MALFSLVSGLGSILLARSLGIFDLTNNLFSSAVAVTGDAHQAQVAQDVFKADIQHELSLLIREDMRDVYALICETVSTQVTMGSIVLGVCFAVLIEGYVETGVQTWIIDLWAMLIAWAVVLTFLSLLLAMYFQTSIGVRVRERLLVTHRIFTPNDACISNMGGYTLAEQVARLHARLVGNLFSFLVDTLPMPAAAPQPHMLDTVADVANGETSVLVELKSENAQGRPYPILVRAQTGVNAWYDESKSTKELVAPRITELPAFLAGGTLVRQPWISEHSKELHLSIKSDATMYIAGRLLPKQEEEENEEERTEDSPFAKSPVPAKTSITDLLDLQKVLHIWEAQQMPEVVEGYHPATHGIFQKVDGFSIFVDQHRIHLPLYKIALNSPDDTGNPQDVKVKFNFTGRAEALTVILREGCVLHSEEEFPKQAFLQEIDVLIPHIFFACRFMQCGTSSLLLAVLFMHLSRVLVVRPWPACAGEVAAFVAGIFVALAGIWMHTPLRSTLDLGHQQKRALWLSGSTWDKMDGGPSSASGAHGVWADSVIAVDGYASTRLWRQKRKNLKRLTIASAICCVVFTLSLGWCLISAMIESAYESSTKTDNTVAASSQHSKAWLQWPHRLHPMLQLVAASLPLDGGSHPVCDSTTLWVATNWLLMPLSLSTGRLQAAPKRLLAPIRGLCASEQRPLVVSGNGLLQWVDRLPMPSANISNEACSSYFSLGAGLSAEAITARGRPLELPAEIVQPHETLACAVEADTSASSTGIMAVTTAGRSWSVLLYNFSGLGGDNPSLEVITRVQLPLQEAGVRKEARITALHLSFAGTCATTEDRVWIADDSGSLLAAGLFSGELREIYPPRQRNGKHAIQSLTGNATHLLAVSAADTASEEFEIFLGKCSTLLQSNTAVEL